MLVINSTENRNPDQGLGRPENEVKKPAHQRHIYFKDASPQELLELRKMRSFHNFGDGESTFFDDHKEKGFFYLNAGYVKVVCRRGNQTEIVRIAGAGDLIGYSRWNSVVGQYGMVALSPVIVSFFKLDEFLRLQERSPYLSAEIARWLMNLVTIQERHIFSMKFRTAKERVASTLHYLRKNFGEAIGGCNPAVSLPIDRKTLADLCGVAVEVLSRVLGELEQEKLILRQGRSIIVTNPDQLYVVGSFK